MNSDNNSFDPCMKRMKSRVNEKRRKTRIYSIKYSTLRNTFVRILLQNVFNQCVPTYTYAEASQQLTLQCTAKIGDFSAHDSMQLKSVSQTDSRRTAGEFYANTKFVPKEHDVISILEPYRREWCRTKFGYWTVFPPNFAVPFHHDTVSQEKKKALRQAGVDRLFRVLLTILSNEFRPTIYFFQSDWVIT